MTEETQDPTATNPDDQETPQEGTTPGAMPAESESGSEDIATLPEWAQRIIRETRAEARDRRLKQKEAQDKAKEQEDKALAEQQKWQELAEKRGTEITTLKTKAGEADELAELLTNQLNAEIAQWPEEVKATAPEGEVSALEMVRWVEKTRPLAEKLRKLSDTSQQRATTPGNPRGPNPASQVPKSQPQNAEPLVDAVRRF